MNRRFLVDANILAALWLRAYDSLAGLGVANRLDHINELRKRSSGLALDHPSLESILAKLDSVSKFALPILWHAAEWVLTQKYKNQPFYPRNAERRLQALKTLLKDFGEPLHSMAMLGDNDNWIVSEFGISDALILRVAENESFAVLSEDSKLRSPAADRVEMYNLAELAHLR